MRTLNRGENETIRKGRNMKSHHKRFQLETADSLVQMMRMPTMLYFMDKLTNPRKMIQTGNLLSKEKSVAITMLHWIDYQDGHGIHLKKVVSETNDLDSVSHLYHNRQTFVLVYLEGGLAVGEGIISF